MIVFNLNIRPNMVVCESGTGSGAMSHCIMRVVAPHGTLHTYEFNEMRAKTAKEEFQRNGVDHLVNVHWRDVCGKPNKEEKEAIMDTETEDVTSSTSVEEKEKEKMVFGSGGFDIGPAAAHAIFLDLPEPWFAIPHAAHTIKPNGSICSYSPCVEQTQRTAQAMRDYGFHSLRTIEVRLREHYVDDVELNTVPTAKLPRDLNVNTFVPGDEQTPLAPVPVAVASPSPPLSPVPTPESNGHGDGNDGNNSAKEKEGAVTKKRRLLCARPFSHMRGHSAFLTFASAGNKSHPDPNMKVL